MNNEKFKNRVAELREAVYDAKKDLNELPKEILVKLLKIAVGRIDENENGGEFDERDAFDLVNDQVCIVDELFERLQRDIELEI